MPAGDQEGMGQLFTENRKRPRVFAGEVEYPQQIAPEEATLRASHRYGAHVVHASAEDDPWIAVVNLAVMVENDPAGRGRNPLPDFPQEGQKAAVLVLGPALRNEEDEFTKNKLNCPRHRDDPRLP
jgi:hypothetical protein